mgnify:CR=1 FL=1
MGGIKSKNTTYIPINIKNNEHEYAINNTINHMNFFSKNKWLFYNDDGYNNEYMNACIHNELNNKNNKNI